MSTSMFVDSVEGYLVFSLIIFEEPRNVPSWWPEKRHTLLTSQDMFRKNVRETVVNQQVIVEWKFKKLEKEIAKLQADLER